MPNWKKLIVSGSDASLNTLNVNSALTASGLSYPNADGTANQVITTDGNGVLSFTNASSASASPDITGSSLITASLSSNVLTFIKGDNTSFNLTLPSSGGGGFSNISATAHLTQSIASTTWSFAHNLDDRLPVLNVFDSNYDVIIPERIEMVDEDNMSIYFSTARSGFASAVVIGVSSSFASNSTNAITASYVDFGNIDNTPTLISGSIQIAADISGSFTSLSSSLEGRVSDQENFSSSLDTTFATDADLNLVSSSVDSLNAATSSYALANQISGSFTSLSSSLEGRVTTNENTLSSLNTATSSYLLNTTDTLDGDLTVTGIVTAQEFHTEFISSSIIYESGSTQFGNSSDDTHIFSGSVNIDGAVSADSYTGIFTGALSSSAQIASDISGSITDLSSSLGGRVAANESFSSSLDTTLLTLSGSFSGSFTGDGSQLSGVTSYTNADTLAYINTLGALSSSAQIASDISGSSTALSSSISARVASNELFSSSLDTSLLTLSGSFSGSFVGDGSQLSGVTSYTDSDTLTYINTLNVVSGSEQINLSNTEGTASHAVSSSYALTASYVDAGAGFPFEGDAIITGSFLVSGSSVDFTDATVISGSIYSGSFVGDGTGLSGLGYGDTKKLNQTIAATTWSFSHNMNEQFPTVTVYNNNNEVIQPSKIEGVDAQTLKLYFGSATSGTAVAVVGGVATTQEAGFNRVFTQTSTATTWSFEHNLGNQYPQVIVYDSNDELVIPGKVEAVDVNNLNIYFDTAQSGIATATVGGTALTASYANTLVVTDTLLSSQGNTDIDTGTETVATVSVNDYDGAFFDYVVKDGTNYRAGTVTSVWDGSSVQYNDNSTADIGDTSVVTLAVDISGTDARLRATTTSDNWNIKAFIRAI